MNAPAGFAPDDRVSYAYSKDIDPVTGLTATILQIWPGRGALLDLDDSGGLIWRPLETLTHI